MRDHVSPDVLRSAFADALSAMYRTEVPLYADLLDIVRHVNEAVLEADPARRDRLNASGDIARLQAERHGAIRVGTPGELSTLRRVFRVMGMFPVAYYDLSVAGVPVHSTAFRPLRHAELQVCPFRVFTSLLRLELIDDEELRAMAAELLASRQIVTDRALALVEIADREGGLTPTEGEEFVGQIVETFRWHRSARVDYETYKRLNDAHRLVADVVAFKGPHINHLTPRTLDIDMAQAEMVRRGIRAKDVIEGPPARKVAVLLRQTSFQALSEPVEFLKANDSETGIGSHTARFGEIEQRGVALTRKGRDLYDALLAKAWGTTATQDSAYAERLAKAFERFPDDLARLHAEGLAYFTYELTAKGELALASGETFGTDLDSAIDQGFVAVHPIDYEDFLPVSAAGIFQSNLGGEEQHAHMGAASQSAFESALGTSIIDPFELYDELARSSREAVLARIAEGNA